MSSKFGLKRFPFSSYVVPSCLPCSASCFCLFYFSFVLLMFTCLMRFILPWTVPIPNLICLLFNAFIASFTFPFPAGLSHFPPKFICWFGIIRGCVALRWVEIVKKRQAHTLTLPLTHSNIRRKAVLKEKNNKNRSYATLARGALFTLSLQFARH